MPATSLDGAGPHAGEHPQLCSGSRTDPQDTKAREPLLDHRLLEFAATVPSSLKLRGRTSKHLLRRLLHRRVPQSILERGKRGFEAPIGEWLRTALAPHVSSMLLFGLMVAVLLWHPEGLLGERTVR